MKILRCSLTLHFGKSLENMQVTPTEFILENFQRHWCLHPYIYNAVIGIMQINTTGSYLILLLFRKMKCEFRNFVSPRVTFLLYSI